MSFRWVFFRCTKLSKDLCLIGCVRLASYRSSKTGGHSHSTRTHQQVLVMDVILGLCVTQASRARQNKDSGGWGRRGHGRSLLIHMPDIMVILLIQTQTQMKCERQSKQRHRANWEGKAGAGQDKQTDNYRVPILDKLIKLKLFTKKSQLTRSQGYDRELHQSFRFKSLEIKGQTCNLNVLISQ